MQNFKKIAIYSGEIPSTTFIERLIEGMAKNHCILLFGFQSKKVKYDSKNVKIVSYNNRISKLFILIKYSILLMIFDFANKRKLDNYINSRTVNHNFLKIKYYPVLYHKPDVFHLQWAKGIEEWIWVQEFGIKLILSLRGAHINYSPIADKVLADKYQKYFPLVDGFHAVSQDIKNETIKYNANPDKIKVIYSGLDLHKLKFNKEFKDFKTLKIISIGRSHWKKGYNYSLDACKILKIKNVIFNYKIIGIDKKAEELIFQKSQLELNDCVEFINQIPFEKVLETIKNADILLLPSIEEGIANVVLEAMSVGTIVLSTNCGGMAEVISDGENGFLVPIRNPKLMAEKIIEISKLSKDNLNVIRQNALDTIKNQHDINFKIKEFDELYQIVLEK